MCGSGRYENSGEDEASNGDGVGKVHDAGRVMWGEALLLGVVLFDLRIKELVRGAWMKGREPGFLVFEASFTSYLFLILHVTFC